MTSTRTLTAVAACAMVLVAGCGEGEKVGGDVNTNIKPGASGNLIPGSPTPKPGATIKPTAAPKATTAPTRAPTRKATPPPTRKPPPEPPAFIVMINGDKSGKALIDPPQVSVYTGYKVTWKNADTKPHGVISTDGSINSGKCDPPKGITATCIQPGKTYTWVAGAPGRVAYKDSSRPYVNAEIQVVPR